MKIERNKLAAVTTPEPTKTWSPIPHIEAVDRVIQQINNAGLQVANEKFEVTKNGEHLFAVMNLDRTEEGIQWSVGMRNSHNKLFALGIAAGTHVLVCSNLCFTGEFVDFRRHTGKLTYDEVDILAEKAIGMVQLKIQETINWQLGLKEMPMPLDVMKRTTFDLMEREVLPPPSQFKHFNAALKEEIRLNGESVYSFHGASTRIMRDKNLFTIDFRSAQLNQFVQEYLAEAA